MQNMSNLISQTRILGGVVSCLASLTARRKHPEMPKTAKAIAKQQYFVSIYSKCHETSRNGFKKQKVKKWSKKKNFFFWKQKLLKIA